MHTAILLTLSHRIPCISGVGHVPNPWMQNPPGCRSPPCADPLEVQPPRMQTSQDADPREADPPRSRPPRWRPLLDADPTSRRYTPWMQTSLVMLGRQSPLPVNRMTDACENITLRQTSWWLNMELLVIHSDAYLTELTWHCLLDWFFEDPYLIMLDWF